MRDCLFCKILNKDIPANIIYEDEFIIAFDDIHPQAPQHKIIIPRKHIPTLNEMQPEDKMLMGHIVYTASAIARTLKLAEDGYRLLSNCNAAAGQTVFHIHFHLLGGRNFTWPPG